ncbi:MAG: DNA-processing protein DprA [Bacteroidota bacterium]
MQQPLWDDMLPAYDRDEEQALVALSLVPGVGPWRIRSLLARFGRASAVFRAPYAALSAIPGIGPSTCEAIRTFDDSQAIENQMKCAAALGAALVVAGSEEFPRLLAETYDPPAFLWVRGDVSALHRPSVAVIGTRRPSDYGRRVAFEIAEALARSGITVVSGFAYGIDRRAHEGALAAGGRTAAVLGSGIDVIYPGSHVQLAESVVGSGCLVSEFPFGTKPDAPNFPRRNRIVSGLTLGTIVVEAHETGGALITARLAIEQNREVFAVPSPVHARTGSGTNRLIRDGHARLIETAEDVLLDLGLTDHAGSQSEQPPPPQLSGLEEVLFDALTTEPVHIDSLGARTDLDSSTALVYLLNLEFKGLVRQMAGKQFFRA